MTQSRTGQGKSLRGGVRRADGRFDGLSVAKRGAVIEGSLDAAQLPRVNDLLAPEGSPSTLSYRIAGTSDGAGRPALEISLRGAVPLTCQRCLQAFVWPIEQRTLLLLARDQRELAQFDDEDHAHEVIAADLPLDPVALAEDELLLTLPYVPRCPDGQCFAARDQDRG